MPDRFRVGEMCPNGTCGGTLAAFALTQTHVVCFWCCRAQLKAPDLASVSDDSTRTADTARAHVREAEEQQAIVELLGQHGYRVWRVGQRDARGTQDRGVPDLIAMHPRDGLVFVECKRPHQGKLSIDQISFRSCCQACGVAFVWGARPDIERYLTKPSRNGPRVLPCEA